MPRYNPATIEPKWQTFWEENQTFATSRLPEGEKLYVLDMFPYPSGQGLHVGHPEGYTATDIVCRYQRMRGRSVMHPMGFDAFGLPAEQYAKKTGTPPRITTEQNIATFRRQLKMLGFSYDWNRELATTDVEYFRWTQWIFLKIYDTWYDADQECGRPISELPIPAEVDAAGQEAVRRYQDEHRLAYQIEALVNWCPALGTVLSNEEVIGGKSERGEHPVMRIPLKQWMLRITKYADRLENDLEGLDWSDGVKALQRNWIGRSTGAEVDFFIGSQSDATDGRPSQSAFRSWCVARKADRLPDKPGEDVLRIYTTRADTLFGATYMVLAPEHAYVERLTTPDQKAKVEAYCQQAAFKSDLDRTDLAKGKTGIFTGSYASNPVNGEAIPIWVADYVLMGYGTGAIMAVPGGDTRDFEFAVEFDLPIICVVDPKSDQPDATRDDILAGRAVFTGEGTAVNSGPYSDLSTAEFKQRIVANISSAGIGRSAVNYKLRDWLFSRQHFWGEPFPILHELDAKGELTGLRRALDEDQLPLDLPEMPKFESTDRPEPPLEQAPNEWLYPVIDGVKYKRETNSMPQWAGSCWYYLRFLDPKNSEAMVDPEVERAWMPVDLYIGGAEHAVLHLLYARFWHKILYDRGLVSTKEPFQKLVNQGMVLGDVEFTGYQKTDDPSDDPSVSAAEVRENADGTHVHTDTGEELESIKIAAEKVVKQGNVFVLEANNKIQLDSRAYKMSKARGNVVNPDVVVKEYGADALRLYEMFMGPLEATKPWSMNGVNGVRNFLDRVWRLVVDDRAETIGLNEQIQDVEPTDEQNRALHRTIQAVSADLDALAFNTAIARMMEFVNFFTKSKSRPKPAMKSFVLLLSPFAPHLAEELWQVLGHNDTLAYEPWPQFDESLIREDTIEIPVQIKGKVRGRITVATDADNATLEEAARADEKIAELLADKQIVKTIIVPGRLVNFVVK